MVGSAFFTLFSSFYTSRGGGSEAPIRQLARWGLLLKLHRTSLSEKNQTSILVSVFTITFAWLVRAVAHFNNFRNGAERLNNSNERKIRRFQPVSVAAGTLRWFCENGLAQKESRWRSVKTCHTTADRRIVFTWGERHSWRIYAALTGGFLSQIFK